MTQTVLFACVHNAGRSQMAAAIFNRRADPEKAKAISAGTAPSHRVHPQVVHAMDELGVSLAGIVPRLLTPAALEPGLAATRPFPGVQPLVRLD